jgi:hypothetical protein
MTGQQYLSGTTKLFRLTAFLLLVNKVKPLELSHEGDH